MKKTLSFIDLYKRYNECIKYKPTRCHPNLALEHTTLIVYTPTLGILVILELGCLILFIQTCREIEVMSSQKSFITFVVVMLERVWKKKNVIKFNRGW